MPENQYPISREDQAKLWDECDTDAHRVSKDYSMRLAMASALFTYRIKILSDRVLDHDMLGLHDDVDNLLEDGS